MESGHESLTHLLHEAALRDQHNDGDSRPLDSDVLAVAIEIYGAGFDAPDEVLEHLVSLDLISECDAGAHYRLTGERCRACDEAARDCGLCTGLGRRLNFADRLVECAGCDGSGRARSRGLAKADAPSVRGEEKAS